ncbi:hypothetical protein PsorP6_014857 [Peronosclerospora sorghi]|uniref:Uncharacterized protein n=1 Tax=Peronosclerospora sorghi TaxID=230839 RepID=A0ACC0VUU7_9STRA|nr:hypothetical protein PsorP6_014857 [Peronosclerospora sorghi]
MVSSLGLLDIVEKRKPIGDSIWEDVAYDYDRNLPSGHESRDEEALRRKFTDATGGAPGEADFPRNQERDVGRRDGRRCPSVRNVDDPDDYSSEDDDEEPTQAKFLI